MTTDASMIEAFIGQLRVLTKKHSMGTIGVMPAEPRARAAYEVDLDPAEFLEALSLFHPKAVYVETSEFRAKWQVVTFHDWSEADDDEDDEGEGYDVDDEDDATYIPSEEQLNRIMERHPAVEAEVQKWSRYDGKTYMVAALFFADGVYHTTSLIEDWMQELNVSRMQLKKSHIEAAEAAGHTLRGKKRAAFLERAERLARDPMFNAPKATREKREYLASRLFPALREGDWSALVAEAANMVWYNTSGAEIGSKKR